MSKVFAVSEIDAQQTIDRFVSENFPESYAIFSQYGNRSQTKTERFTTVPCRGRNRLPGIAESVFRILPGMYKKMGTKGKAPGLQIF